MVNHQWQSQEFSFGVIAQGQGAWRRKTPIGVQGRSRGRGSADEFRQKLEQFADIIIIIRIVHEVHNKKLANMTCP